jgi:hypothetical protein
MKHAQDELVWVDSNGVVHPLGESAGEQMKRRKDGAFRLMPTPDHVIFMRFTGQDGRRDEEDGAVVRLAGEIVSPGTLCDVLALVAQAGWRGELTVRDGEHNRSMFIEGGNAVSARTDVEDERHRADLVSLRGDRRGGSTGRSTSGRRRAAASATARRGSSSGC